MNWRAFAAKSAVGNGWEIGSKADGSMFAWMGNGGWYSDGNNGWLSASGIFETGKWQHWAVTYDGTTYKFFVDGIEVFSQVHAS